LHTIRSTRGALLSAAGSAPFSSFYQGKVSFEALRTPEDVIVFFKVSWSNLLSVDPMPPPQTYFADALALMPKVDTEFFEKYFPRLVHQCL